jgi:hypothetical protein
VKFRPPASCKVAATTLDEDIAHTSFKIVSHPSLVNKFYSLQAADSTHQNFLEAKDHSVPPYAAIMHSECSGAAGNQHSRNVLTDGKFWYEDSEFSDKVLQ